MAPVVVRRLLRGRFEPLAVLVDHAVQRGLDHLREQPRFEDALPEPDGALRGWGRRVSEPLETGAPGGVEKQRDDEKKAGGQRDVAGVGAQHARWAVVTRAERANWLDQRVKTPVEPADDPALDVAERGTCPDEGGRLTVTVREDEDLREQQAKRAEPGEDVDDGVLLRGEAKRHEEGHSVEESGPSRVVEADQQAERGEHERRDEDVAAHEPRVKEHDGVDREQKRHPHRLAIAQVGTEQERRQRQQTADDGDGQAHREVVRPERGEHVAVDVLDERAVDDAPVGERAGLAVVERPVGHAPLVEVGWARPQEGESECECEYRDADDQFHECVLVGVEPPLEAAAVRAERRQDVARPDHTGVKPMRD